MPTDAASRRRAQPAAPGRQTPARPPRPSSSNYPQTSTRSRSLPEPLRPWLDRARRHPDLAFLLLAALLLLALYGRALTAPFVYDDLDQVVNNPNLTQWTAFAARFLLRPVHLTTSLLGNAGSTYRPLFWLSLFVDRRLWDLDPFGFHLTNLVLHLANGCLAFALLRRLPVRASAAAGIALLWLVLPVNTEVVAWVSARAYLLCTLFALLALLASLRFLRDGKLLWLTLALLASLGAALSHELGLLTPLLAALTGLAFPDANRRRLAALVCFLLAAPLLVWLWRLHLGVNTPAVLAPLRWSSLALAQYLALTVFPVHLSVERSTALAAARLNLAACALLACLLFAFLHAALCRRYRPLLALLWFALGLAPFCLLRNYQGSAERFLYLASFGLVAAAVAFALSVPPSRLRSACLAVLALWFVASAVRTAHRVGDWTDPVRLYRASLLATPQSPSLHYNLGFTLRERGDLAAAEGEYRRALELDPHFPNGWASLGDVFLKQHRYADARDAYGRALAAAPDDPAVLLNSAAAWQGAGSFAQAEASYLRVIALAPASSTAHSDLGILYLTEHRTDDAMHQFAMAIDLKSISVVPYYNLGAILQQAGRPDLAMVLYRKALDLSPNDPDTLHAFETLQPVP